MKIRTIGYLTAFIILAAGITAIAEEAKIKALSADEYQALISSYNKADDCVFSRNINSWVVLDNQSLILYAPSKKHPFYAKLSRRSHNLKFTQTIGIYSKFDNRFCPYGGNALFIDGDRYSLWAIKKLDKNTAKQLIAYSKKK